MTSPRERNRDNTELAIAVGLAHYHRAVFDRITMEVRPWCSRVVKEGVLARVHDIWNAPQPFKATYCKRCDGFGVPPRAVQLFYLRADIMKRLGNMTDEAKRKLDENCLEVWRVSDWAPGTFELVGKTLNRERYSERYPPKTLAELTRRMTADELYRHEHIIDGCFCTDFAPQEVAIGERVYETAGTLAEVDHA